MVALINFRESTVTVKFMVLTPKYLGLRCSEMMIVCKGFISNEQICGLCNHCGLLSVMKVTVAYFHTLDNMIKLSADLKNKMGLF